MDNLIELERILDLLKQLFSFHSLNRVTLSRSNQHHTILILELKTLLRTALDDVLDFLETDIHSGNALDT